MEAQKLSFDAFKSMASNVQSAEVLSQIEGGGLFDCHGWWGAFGKKVRDIAEDAALRELRELLK
jgi:hypothetical protein